MLAVSIVIGSADTYRFFVLIGFPMLVIFRSFVLEEPISTEQCEIALNNSRFGKDSQALWMIRGVAV